MSDVWTERIKAIATAVTAILAALGVFISAWNNQKIATVQDHQAVNSQKLDEAKVEASAAKTEAAETKKVLTETKKTVEVTAEKVGAMK